jgi:hemerythrin-like domain-containing protein
MKLEDFVPKSLLNNDADDAISILTADHDKVKELFKQFEGIKDRRGTRQKERIVADACHELTIHTKIEEEIFYPAVRAAIDDDDLMNEAKVEHTGAKELIRQLESMKASDEMFVAKFTVLSEYVRHHIDEEHNEMFPKVRKTELDLVALGQKMLKRKHDLSAASKSGNGGRVAARKPKTNGGRTHAQSAR